MRARLLLLAVPVVLLLSSCFLLGLSESAIEQMQIYNLEVTQNGKWVTMKVTFNEDELRPLLENFFKTVEQRNSEGDFEEVVINTYDFTQDIYFWLEPKIQNQYWSYFYPVARQAVQVPFTAAEALELMGDGESPIELDFEVTVKINLAKLAEESRAGLLYGIFSPDNTNSRLEGFSVIMADGYTYDWESTEIDGKYIEFGDGKVMAGLGRSNLVDYSEDFTDFNVESAGLYMPYDVYGGQEYILKLVLASGETLENPVDFLRNFADEYDFDETNCNAALSDPGNGIYLWTVIFDHGLGDPANNNFVDLTGDPGDEINYIYPGEKYSSFVMRLERPAYWALETWCYYQGTKIVLYTQDFEDSVVNDGMLDTESGTGRTTEEYWGYNPDYGYYDYFTPDNAANNWKIGAIDAAAAYDGYQTGGSVLKLTEDSGYYQPNRNDFIALPELDLQTLSGGRDLQIAFMMRRELDYNWSDYVELQIERDSWYDSVNSWRGPLDDWLEQSNGWTTYTGDIYQWQYMTGGQNLRFRFYSDSWGENKGVFIDNFEIYYIE